MKNEASILLLLLSEGGFVGWEEPGRRVLLPTWFAVYSIFFYFFPFVGCLVSVVGCRL